MTLGLPCDRDGYDLRIQPCNQCGSRGCPNMDRCKNDIPAFRAQYLCEQADRLEEQAEGEVRAVWHAMIDSILNEDGK